MELFIALLLWVIFGMLSAAVAHESKKTLAFILGLFLGPLGILVSAIALRKP